MLVSHSNNNEYDRQKGMAYRTAIAHSALVCNLSQKKLLFSGCSKALEYRMVSNFFSFNKKDAYNENIHINKCLIYYNIKHWQ